MSYLLEFEFCCITLLYCLILITAQWLGGMRETDCLSYKKEQSKIANGYYNAHTEPLFKLYRILKRSDILTLQTLKIFHKFTNNELPAYVQNWRLITDNEIHQHNTRRACDLHTFRFHHMFAKKSHRHNIVHTINNTPDNVFNKFNTHSLEGFTNYVKLHYVK